MAEKDSKSGGPVPWANITALLMAVAGGVSLLIQPLVSSRPQKGSPSVEVNGEQDVDARLWQDPLRVAIEDFQKSGASNHADLLSRPNQHLQDLRNEVSAHRGKATHPRLIILPALIPGGPYPEDNERRLRSRQAVVSGLAASGFTPRDGQRIGYFLLPDLATDTPVALSAAHVVPYEWFVPRYGDPTLAQPEGVERILILWVRDDLPGRNTMETLRDLGEALDWDPARERVAVLGPGNSTSLTTLLRDDAKVDAPQGCLNGVELFAAMPTASSAVMQLGPNGRAASSVERLRCGATLFRTINTDDDVAQMIVEELARRRVNLRANVTAAAAKNDSALQHIAVISESDTVYGRSLPLTLLAQIYGGTAQHPLENFMRGKQGGLGTSEKSEWFHNYSYLRGLDGRLPAEGAPAKSTPPPSPEKSPVPREATEGENQADYLRRLAGQLAAKNQELIRRGGHGIKAVGVLGSDVYDKLMILRALRAELPGALFFTNNLDARLALPEEWHAAHNLIVVSPFGLSLDGRLQRNIPPFRDSYQTSVFAATLMITKVLPTPQSRCDLWPPRVFEISREGPWDLSVTQRHFLDPPRLDVRPWLGNPGRKILVAIACFSLAALLLWIALTSSWIRQPHEMDEPRRVGDEIGGMFASTPVAAAVALAAGFVCVWPLYFLQRAGGEPLAFTQGISIWPTEMVRVAIVVLCAHFVWKSTLALRRSNQDIRREHCLGKEEPREGGNGHTRLQEIIAELREEITWARTRLRERAFGWRSQSWSEPEADGGAPTPDEKKRIDENKRMNAEILWQEYLERGRWSRRLLRFGPLVLLYLIGGVALFFLLGFPAVPARGATSFRTDLVLLILCILSTIFLLFYVVDAIRLNRDLIKLFNQGISVWPEPARVRSKRNLLLNEEELAEYLDIRLIAARTEVVCPLVNYPFLILLLMIVARNSYFDNWDWPWSLLFILALNLGWAIYISLQLFRAARKARHTAVNRLSEHRLAALYSAGTERDPEARRVAKAKLKMIEETTAEINDLNRGAFAPLSDQPFLRAILFTLGSIGIGSLLQFLPNFF